MESLRYPESVLALTFRLGGLLRLARAERGWTQTDMALRLRVSAATIKKIESGAPGTAFGTIVEACSLLGLSPDPAAPGNQEQHQHSGTRSAKRVRRKPSRPELDV